MNARGSKTPPDRAVSDRQLLQRWRDGDARAGNQLFRRHFRDMYRFFHHKVGGDADDLIQATFFACVRARDQFQGRSSFRTYLYRVARNVLYAYYRDRGRRRVDFSATSLGDLSYMKWLLDQDPKLIHERGAHDFPLMWFAALNGSLEVAELLLHHGADVDQESMGTTALHLCARRGRTELADWLLERGADPDLVDGKRGESARQLLEGRANG